jgi:putative transposase
MAGYVGDAVTIRYDPRDLSEIRVFYRNTFLCRAVSEEHAGEVVTLKDIQAARRLHRRSLRTTINERVSRVVDFCLFTGTGQTASGRTASHAQGATPDKASYLSGGR